MLYLEMSSNCAKLACSKGLKTRKNMTNWVRSHGPDKTSNVNFEKVRNCWQGRTLPNSIVCNSPSNTSVVKQNAAIAKQNAVVAQQVAKVAEQTAIVAQANASNLKSMAAQKNVVVAKEVANVAKQTAASAVAMANISSEKPRTRNSPEVAMFMNSYGLTRDQLRAQHPELYGHFKGNVKKTKRGGRRA
jgi:hypothetical protein